jgi:hypothetical protein
MNRIRIGVACLAGVAAICAGSVGHADHVLILHGLDTLGFDSYSPPIKNPLVALGHTVDTSVTLPTNLAAYDVVWDIRFVDLPEAELLALAGNMRLGKGLLIAGENSSWKQRNDTIAAWLQAAGAGNITVKSECVGTDQVGDYKFLSTAPGGLVTTPNMLTDPVYIPCSSSFATLGNLVPVLQANASHVVFAAWESGPNRLIFPLDVDWASNNSGNGYTAKIIENLERWLKGTAPPPSDGGLDRSAPDTRADVRTDTRRPDLVYFPDESVADRGADAKPQTPSSSGCSCELTGDREGASASTALALVLLVAVLVGCCVTRPARHSRSFRSSPPGYM